MQLKQRMFFYVGFPLLVLNFFLPTDAYCEVFPPFIFIQTVSFILGWFLVIVGLMKVKKKGVPLSLILKIFLTLIIFYTPAQILHLSCYLNDPEYGCFGNDAFLLIIVVPAAIIASIIVTIIHFILKKRARNLS